MFGLIPNSRRQNEIMRAKDPWGIISVFDEFFNEAMFPESLNSNPLRADIRETEKEYIVDAEVPGVRKEDIKIELREDILTISVEQNDQKEEKTDNYLRRERRTGSFKRSIMVQNVNNEAVTAKYDNGVLTITLPKDEVNKKDYRIDIN